MKIYFRFAWYDLWIGAYYNHKERTWYICLLPTLRIIIKRSWPKFRLGTIYHINGFWVYNKEEHIENGKYFKIQTTGEKFYKDIKRLYHNDKLKLHRD